VTRGWIGIEAQELTPELAESFGLPPSQGGALIAGVLSGGPADRAGLRPGDVLVQVGDKPVKDPNGMLNLVTALAPGKPARLKIRRASRETEVTVVVGRRPPAQRRPG
jgi:S1-C subfamily serine protease